jgi:hypothetical protein
LVTDRLNIQNPQVSDPSAPVDPHEPAVGKSGAPEIGGKAASRL